MKTYKVYVNEEGRYLANIFRNGDVDTTKVLEDARLWRTDSNTRMGNLRAFTKKHKELLDSKGFILEDIKIK